MPASMRTAIAVFLLLFVAVVSTWIRVGPGYNMTEGQILVAYWPWWVFVTAVAVLGFVMQSRPPKG